MFVKKKIKQLCLDTICLILDTHLLQFVYFYKDVSRREFRYSSKPKNPTIQEDRQKRYAICRAIIQLYQDKHNCLDASQ